MFQDIRLSLRRHRAAFSAVGFYIFAMGASVGLSCGAADAVVSWCEEACDCVDCDDDERAACESVMEGLLERAIAYDCEDEYIALLECEADKGRCDEDDDELDLDTDGKCADESEDFYDCRASASDIYDDE